MATSSFDCVLCKRGTHPRARRCLSKPANKHLLAVLQSFVADSSSFSFNTVDKNSWLCRPCSRSLEQLQAARERVENLETDIRKKLEAINDECQGSSVSATSTANRPVAVARTFTTPERLPAAGSPLFEQWSDRGTTGEAETARRRYDMPTRSALERMVPSASSPAVAVSLLVCALKNLCNTI